MEPDPRSDQQLVEAANKGDDSAFEALYFRYRDWVKGLAWRFTGDRQVTLDVLQETFTYLWGKFPGFTLTASMKTFLYPVVRHLSIRLQKKERRQLNCNEMLEQAEADADQTTSRQKLAQVLRTLPEEQREVVLMRFVDGMSVREVARALDIPEGTAKSRQHNALQKLREDPRTRAYFLGEQQE